MFEDLFNSVHTNLVRTSIPLFTSLLNLSPTQNKGDDRPSLSATLIREADRHQLSMRENSWLAGTM
jgi:hypothetical protein